MPTPLAYDTYYHIYNRGNNRENLFREAENYHYFLRLYASYVPAIADTFVYCLLPNHFHLLVRIKSFETCQQNCQAAKDWQTYQETYPSRVFSKFFGTYTKAINKRYRRTGSLFESPFRRNPVDSDRYFTALVIYIHQNPQKHGLVSDFRDWPYSSYHTLLSTGPTQLKREGVLRRFKGSSRLQQQHQSPLNEAGLLPLIADDFD